MSQTILTRLSSSSLQTPTLSTTQIQVDGLVTHFVEEAANPRTLAAITAGGMAYRFGRIGTLALGEGHVAAMPLRLLSYGAGLGSEVTAFEFTNRSLISLSSSPLTSHSSPNLWNWSGTGGWREGLASSAITFGMLKGAGSLGREQNLIFQHAFQSTAMVAGHNAAGFFGIGPRPEGSLAEQFLHAEATNIQLGAGSSLLHSFAPGISALERGLDFSLQGRAPYFSSLNDLRNPALQEALATGTPEGRDGRAPTQDDILKRPFVVMMSSTKGKGGGGNEGSGDGESLPVHPPSRRTTVPDILGRIAKITTREGAKEALSQLAAGLKGRLQRRVMEAQQKIEGGEPITPIIQSIVEDPSIKQAAFITPGAKEDIKRKVEALQEGETIHSTNPPSPVVGGGRPTVIGFKRMTVDLEVNAEDMAKVLNRTFAPLIDLTRYTSFTGNPIYIAEEDETKLNDYAKLDFQSLGELLFFSRKELTERNWTLSEAARQLRMEAQELEDIERNDRLPNQKQLERFARIYKLHPGFLKDTLTETALHFPSLSQPPITTGEFSTGEQSDLDPRSGTGDIPDPPVSLPPDPDKLAKHYAQRLQHYEDASRTPHESWAFDPVDGFSDIRGIARYFADENKNLRGQIDRDEKTGVLSMNGLKRMTKGLERRLLIPHRRSTDEISRANWVLYLDIDNFKNINTVYHHTNADVVIKAVAQIMMDTVRMKDLVVRSSQAGDEFIIWLASSERQGAERVASDILQAISGHTFEFKGRPPLNVTMSIGAAVVRPLANPESGGEPIVEGALEDAIRRANASLFDAKRKGKNCLSVSDD